MTLITTMFRRSTV